VAAVMVQLKLGISPGVAAEAAWLDRRCDRCCFYAAVSCACTTDLCLWCCIKNGVRIKGPSCSVVNRILSSPSVLTKMVSMKSGTVNREQANSNKTPLLELYEESPPNLQELGPKDRRVERSLSASL
jgi:hypothetical protein